MEADDRPRTRLFVEEPLAPGRTVRLARDDAHHVCTVLRLKQGDRVALFNGQEGEWSAVLEAAGKGWCTLAVERQRRPQRDGPDLWLLFAPIKRARLDLLVEKATELGASRLRPVLTEHTAVTAVNLARLNAHARAAAEQSERLTVPAVDQPTTLGAALAAWPKGRTLLACAEAGAARPIAEALGALAAGPAAIVVGPEGGFSNRELDALTQLPFVVLVGLGPRILRADTAVLAALACWQALRGDWAEAGVEARPPGRGAV